MQKDRQRSRSGGVFNLGDGNDSSEVLTHRGQALGNNYRDNDGQHEEQDDDLNAEVVNQLHFGGGGGGNSHLGNVQVKFELLPTAADTDILSVVINTKFYVALARTNILKALNRAWCFKVIL